MFYDITGLCPRRDIMMGGYGFTIKLYPQWKDMVKASKFTAENIKKIINDYGREWLDACGYDMMVDPDDNRSPWEKEEKPQPMGPNAYPLYKPNLDLRVGWGEWGPEHISVPGNACGLDIDIRGIYAPPNGAILIPHNVDCWKQVQILLITFCWFADTMSLEWQFSENVI